MITKRLKNKLSHLVNKALPLFLPKPDYALYFGNSLGDNLLLTAVAKEIKGTNPRNKVYIFSKLNDLFLNNPHIDKVLDPGLIPYFKNWPVSFLKYHDYIETEGRFSKPDKHIINIFLNKTGLKDKEEPRPYLFLTEKEMAEGKLYSNQITIMSSGRSANVPFESKEWGYENFQKVVSELIGNYQVIQLGSETDPQLQGAIDLRGKTNLRQSAAILTNSRLFIGLEGFLMHLAKAVDCPSLIIFGGRSSPNVFGYKGNSNLVSKPECYECYTVNKCHYDYLCMKLITPDDVMKTLSQILHR